jgi:exopolysaccharide biosynthesis WecB/TagA/CpsF family protein
MQNNHGLTESTMSWARDVTALPTRDILGIPVSVATKEEALRFLDDRLQQSMPTCVSFLNANGSNLAANQPLLAAAYHEFVVFNDGIGVDIASRMLHGNVFPDNLNGTDFVPWALCNTCHSLRIFILGGDEGVAQRGGAEFQRLAPQHHYVGSHQGYFDKNEIPEILASITHAQTDFLIVALGTPLQELWLAENFLATHCKLAICVGGLLDFISGTKPRAPKWMRQIRFEWLYRIMLEPRRMWRRYLVGNLRFLARVVRAMMGRNKRPVARSHPQ